MRHVYAVMAGLLRQLLKLVLSFADPQFALNTRLSPASAALVSQHVEPLATLYGELKEHARRFVLQQFKVCVSACPFVRCGCCCT
jgi:hypothetical protein